jgi:hypothetical protein
MNSCQVARSSRRKHCWIPNQLHEFQPFPERGPLARAINIPLTMLRRTIPEGLHTRPVYAYIITTVKTRDGEFFQEGSAPNFQGGCITLCTCKHKDRASAPRPDCHGPDAAEPWNGIWVAGLCSRNAARPRGLFYLMLVNQTFEHHAACWHGLSRPSAKSAHRDKFGDVYEPLSRASELPWSEKSYMGTVPGHVHDDLRSRKRDIAKTYFGRPSTLLVGDPKRSYLWSAPNICLTSDAEWGTAHHRFIPQLNELLLMLQ